jgi:integrase
MGRKIGIGAAVKGGRDRELPLTQKVLDALRQYWRPAKIKPRVYLLQRATIHLTDF